MEVMIPIEKQAKAKATINEWNEAQRRVASKLVDGEDHFAQLGQIGKVLWEFYLGQGHKRAKAFENPSLLRFMRDYFYFVEQRAAEMGYRFEDVRISQDSGITREGVLVLRVEPLPGAKKVRV